MTTTIMVVSEVSLGFLHGRGSGDGSKGGLTVRKELYLLAFPVVETRYLKEGL